MQLLMCLVASVVAMATAAPIANDVKLINTVGGDGLERAKRAQEQLVFGNQQNKPRLLSKKSDPSLALDITNAEAVPQGEQDEGSMMVTHEETPVSADLEGRIEAAQEGGNQKVDIGDAMESAMHAAVSSDIDTPDAAIDDGSPDSSETVETENLEEAPSIDDGGDIENDDGEAGSESSESEAISSDDVEKELLKASTSESQDPSETEGVDQVTSDSVHETSEELSPVATSGEEENDEVQDFLNELQKQDDNGNNLDTSPDVVPNMNDYYKNMYQYMSPPRYPEEQDSYPVYPYLPIYYRRRRSSPHFRRNQQLTLGNRRRTRRIKRDLFDDLALSDIGDSYRGGVDNYLPLSDEELEYFYSKLLPYLAEAYAEESDDDENSPYDTLEALRPYSLQEELEPEQEQDYKSQIPLFAEPEEEQAYQPQIPLFPELEEEQAYQPQIPIFPERPYEDMELGVPMSNEYPLEKRGYMGHLAAPQRKRYFFPFSDEPETHWGAFVPEKRGYDEAIHRLQRLAMALSDEPGPYYSQLLGEYKKK